MSNVLIVTEDFFNSPQLPACCLFSGQTENVRARRVKFDRDTLTRQCVVLALVSLSTCGLGLVLLLLFRRGSERNVPCERRALMRWSLQRNLGVFTLLGCALVGMILAGIFGDLSMLSLYTSSPRAICGCCTMIPALGTFLFGTTGGWILLGSFGVGLVGLCIAQGLFYLQCVTVRALEGSGEIEIHFPESQTDAFIAWRDAFIAYTHVWNETHQVNRQAW